MSRRQQPAPWSSTPDAMRHRPRGALSLPKPVWDYLRALPPGTASRYVEALVRADAATRGTPIAEEPGSS